MPVIDINTDTENLTMTVTAEFAAPIERVWHAYSDPRQLERFWGPPGWPATFHTWDHTIGGRADYSMTGPRGESSRAYWEFLTINEPHGFTVLDGFSDDQGKPNADMPAMRMEFAFEPTGDGTRMVTSSHFDSLEALQQVVDMGVIEGTRAAMSQIDAVLHDLREYAQGKGTRVEYLDDTHVSITRLVDGPRDLVWRAYTEPELIKQWMLGPDGWEMTECEVALKAGERYRNSWAPVGDTEGEPFGFEGETLLVDAPRRAVQLERMQGTDGPDILNDMNLYEEDGATLVTVLMEFPDKDTRDMILATGMADGMESSYQRLEQAVLTV
ncbi:SRPBCC family protein [Microbacterium sp. H1-D42]|uniref:SRPBCC family protein n=1 Tax=Microbacterium sp. H1-D42 TaxID=2925844 RepID=UPI001F53A1DC|nr:SRPBCC family protein [Microbacterium sp. H1-D42]UNK70656.1 SRPBCC domain-containing protein [Microbacterium sp. H1-D42]